MCQRCFACHAEIQRGAQINHELFFNHAEQRSLFLLCRDMLDASPGVSWDDIAGLAEAKRVLQENVILPLYMPEYFQGIRRPVKVIYLHYMQ